MKNFSFAAWPILLYLLLSGYTTHARPSHYTPHSPSLTFGVTNAHRNTNFKSESLNFPVTATAHSGSQPGTQLSEDFAKNETLFEALAEFVSFQNQGFIGSARVAGLDFFGSFFGNEKKNIEIQAAITGTVTDANGPLPGVTITVKGKTITTITDTSGNFTIDAKGDDTLIFTSISYKTLEVPINGKTIINATLTEDQTALQEVTVNAGYYKVKDKHRTGSIAKIKATDIEQQPVSNPLAAMQGRMSGVNITQSSGTPGSGFSIQIRGLNSIRSAGNDPLYVVDGVPYTSQSLGNSDVRSGLLGTQSSPLNSINPTDIESIEVLKDADATAIYGSRGANGVVLITTKKGKAGKARIGVQAATTVGRITNRLSLLNTQEYLNMRREAFANDDIIEYPADAYDVNGTWDQNRDTNWQEELLGGTSYINNVQLSVSGGSEETQYLLSGTWRDETTVFPGDSHFTKNAVHSSFSHKSPDGRFRLQFSADYSNDRNRLADVDFARLAYTLAPNAPALYDESGNLNWENGTFENPLGALEGAYKTTTQNLIANTLISYNIGKGFELKSSFGYTDTKLAEARTRPSTMYNPIYEVTSEYSQLLVNNGARKSWIVEPQITWEGNWKGITINTLAGATFQDQQQQGTALEGYGFPSNNVINSLVAAYAIRALNHENTRYRYAALFSRLNLNYDSKYILNFTARRDGSSRFGQDKRFANFGAVGAAWLFSNESFFKENSTISFGKLRGSFGITGNDQIGDYQYLDTYQVTANIYDGITGLGPARLFNPAFGWETNKKLEVGLELGFLKDRLFLTAAWFQNRSGNQLVGIPLPGTTGFPSIQANLEATVENTGFEFDLRSENLKGRFSWTTSLNLSILKNRLLEFPNIEGSTYANNFVVGESLNIRKVYRLTGVDAATGLYTFEDFNGDGLITSAEDRQVIIDTTPEYFGGLSNQFSYKNWSFDFLFQFVKQKGLNVPTTFPIPGSFSNQPSVLLDNPAQSYTTGGNAAAVNSFSNYTRSDAAVTDASFVRLKSIALNYELPKAWTKGFTGRIYIQGQNLLTVTSYKGPDPENQNAVYLPPLKQLTLGVQLSL